MNFWVGGLPLALGLWGDERVPAWRTVIGCPLKDGEVADVFGDFRNELHSGGTGADDRHPLACEVHFFLRPAGSVIRLTLETVYSRKRERIAGGQDADRGEKKLRPRRCRPQSSALRAPAPGDGTVDTSRIPRRRSQSRQTARSAPERWPSQTAEYLPYRSSLFNFLIDGDFSLLESGAYAATRNDRAFGVQSEPIPVLPLSASRAQRYPIDRGMCTQRGVIQRGILAHVWEEGVRVHWHGPPLPIPWPEGR